MIFEAVAGLMTLDAMVFKIFCERDVSDAGTLRCGRFCDAGIASVACINLYPFFGSILLYLIILIARNVLHLPELQSRELLMVIRLSRRGAMMRSGMLLPHGCRRCAPCLLRGCTC
jgi:hypothetical protein